MIKVFRSPIGVINILFSTDKQAVSAKELIGEDFKVQKKWEKQIKVTTTEGCEDIHGEVEHVFKRACTMPGFKKLEVSITENVDIFQSLHENDN